MADEQKQKRVLVTGGAGFIGSHVVDALVAAGEQVTVVDLKTPDEAENLQPVMDKITYVSGDIRDAALMDSLCREHTHVIHLAALVSVPQSIADPISYSSTNVQGTLQVFASAAAGGVKRVIYASSAAVYGDAGEIVVKEVDPTDPRSPYALQKLMNELQARHYHTQHGLDTVGLRFFNVYGDRQDPNSSYSGIISILRNHLANNTNPTIFGDGKQTRDYVHVSDVARANLLALEKGTPGAVYNIATGKRTSLNELLDHFATVTGQPFTPTYTDARAGDITHSLADVTRAAAELGFTASTELPEGLRDLLAGN